MRMLRRLSRKLKRQREQAQLQRERNTRRRELAKWGRFVR